MERTMFRKRWWLAPVFLGAMALFVWIAMLLWNSLMPGIFHLPQINYWEAAGLLILSRLLFGFGGHWGRPGRHHMRQKWEKMNPEEREKFREHLRNHHHFWEDVKESRGTEKSENLKE